MTVREEQGWSEVLSLNRLPEHITGKRVTELMDLSGEKTFVTGAGGDGSAQAIASRLAGLGADLALIGRTFEKVERRGEPHSNTPRAKPIYKGRTPSEARLRRVSTATPTYTAASRKATYSSAQVRVSDIAHVSGGGQLAAVVSRHRGDHLVGAGGRFCLPAPALVDPLCWHRCARVDLVGLDAEDPGDAGGVHHRLTVDPRVVDDVGSAALIVGCHT
jgi:hypothetical protein